MQIYLSILVGFAFLSTFAFQKYSPQRRHSQVYRISSAVRLDFFGVDTPEITEVFPTIYLRVAIEDLAPEPGTWHPNAIVDSRDWSKVADDGDDLGLMLGLSHEAQHTLLRVASVNPLEACRTAVQFVQCFLSPIHMSEVRDPTLHLPMRIVLEQTPLEAFIMGPFLPLTEFAAHEQKLLCGLSVHVGVEQAQIGEFLPEVSRHFGE